MSHLSVVVSWVVLLCGAARRQLLHQRFVLDGMDSFPVFAGGFFGLVYGGGYVGGVG